MHTEIRIEQSYELQTGERRLAGTQSTTGCIQNMAPVLALASKILSKSVMANYHGLIRR